jgi:hypothetical protein
MNQAITVCDGIRRNADGMTGSLEGYAKLSLKK